jgi:transcriptional regulator with XRE-family HTH domain
MPKQRINQKNGQKKNNLDHIGTRVFELRKEFNLTQKELGEILGVTGPSVLAAERSSRGQLVMEAILFFAETFQVNPSWVFLVDNKGIPKFINRSKDQKSFHISDMDISINAPGVIAEKLRMQVMLLLKSVDKVMELSGKEKILAKEPENRRNKKAIKIPRKTLVKLGSK